jgi:hypothetical protein
MSQESVLQAFHYETFRPPKYHEQQHHVHLSLVSYGCSVVHLVVRFTDIWTALPAARFHSGNSGSEGRSFSGDSEWVFLNGPRKRQPVKRLKKAVFRKYWP